MNETICTVCGKDVAIGDWPWCPHGKVEGVAVITDDIPGGFVQENFGHQPETFYSKRAMYQRADALNLRPATPGELKRGGAGVTAKTLDDARVLLSRGTQTTEETRCTTASFTVSEIAHVD